ncbi:two-component sensor histidine kinase [Virgibacillus profundi]|uniref:histidine kinase n=1 Tax=Virgibacillus profundi TaxID=2024555 RepID=A0A2A2IGH5_9BACI|nr:HAMP domain-containing sensor histidine kinase [Virgibacillus profundi]PAV30642.1 two-component sensor histidine kinase [Virgibacillus profundi]PXY54814.1 sensor histidine kinase [Virgibacillus profundi]
MKLQSQLNAAFTTLLLIIMAVTGYVIYSMILDMLIQDEQRQLGQKGDILVDVLNEQYGTRLDLQEFSNFLQDQDLQLFMYDRNQDTVFFSTMSSVVANGFFQSNDFSDENENLWEYQNDKYVTSRIMVYPESTGLELILLTPMNDLQIVQQNFFLRLLVVFLFGGAAAVLLSYFLTNKLVTPLSQLKRQLKKIEKRQFDDIERIKATGEIKEVEQSVYDMAQELQRYMNSQQTFFQNASHELKTPLMTIQGYAEGIKDKIFDEKDEEKGLEVMVSEVKRLKMIINEMILLAKLDSEANAYQPEHIDVSLLIDQVVDRALPLINEKDIVLGSKVDSDINLVADKEKLLRALLNLTFNGIRHAKSQVNIITYRKDRLITIRIEDDGDGIPEELIPHIFHRFVKGKNGETGLGLAIARAIIEQSGGKISVGKSELGGASFEITFTSKLQN